MRCTKARRVMAVDLDGAATVTEQERLAAHLGTCAACRLEAAKVARLGEALGRLAGEATVSQALEDAVVRRIRSLEVDSPRWTERFEGWFRAPVIAAAFAMVLLLVVVGRERLADPGTPGPVARLKSDPTAEAPADRGAAKTSERAVASPARSGAIPGEVVEAGADDAPTGRPAAPPPEMLAELPLLLDLPILRNMEKLEHFDTIAGVLPGDGSPSGERETNG